MTNSETKKQIYVESRYVPEHWNQNCYSMIPAYWIVENFETENGEREYMMGTDEDENIEEFARYFGYDINDIKVN